MERQRVGDGIGGSAEGGKRDSGVGKDGSGSSMTRRDFLKLSASVVVGLAVGAGGLAAIEKLAAPKVRPAAAGSEAAAGSNSANEAIPLYGEHQPGIVTPQQTYMYLASFRITAADRAAVIRLFRDWTKFADLSSSGGTMRTGDNPLLPPSDTGETLDLPASRLTVTFGFGPSFFGQADGKDRFGIAGQLPRYLKAIPRMPRDQLDPLLSGGDICVQVCAEDQQVAFHAVRNFIRLSTGTASVNWLQEGFIRRRKATATSSGPDRTNRPGCKAAPIWRIAKCG